MFARPGTVSLLGFLLAITGCSINAGVESLDHVEPVVLLDVVHSDSVARVSEGDIEVLADGRLAFVYQQSGVGGSDFDQMDLVLRTSDDQGATWTDPEILVSSSEAAQNVMSPTILRAHDGELLLFYLRKNGPWDCHMYVRRSDDELATLSEPVLAIEPEGYFVVNNSRPIQLASGRLLVPASFHPADGELEWSSARMSGIPVIFYSDDVGLTWHQSQTSLETPPVPGVQLQEPGVIELTDGRVMMWMRTNDGFQYESFSNDQGVSWSTPVPGPLASPLSPATIARIPSTNELVVVWNDRSGDHPLPDARADTRAVGGRTPLAVAISSDEGLTWSRSRLLEEGAGINFQYPAITFDDDRMIVSYTICPLGEGCDIRVKAVDLGWLLGEPSEQ
ncbi:MAG: sialidase family protein [Rhodothermales bacterium]